jgi:hypothetical protein
MSEKCENCRHFHTVYGSDWRRDIVIFGIPKARECRRNPPAVGPIRWPSIGKQDWCGQWEAKLDE